MQIISLQLMHEQTRTSIPFSLLQQEIGLVSTKSKEIPRLYTLNQTNIFVPKYVFVGDTHPPVLHTRLCNKCSALNYEIYLKNLTDTTLCRCGYIGTSEHFFFTM